MAKKASTKQRDTIPQNVRPEVTHEVTPLELANLTANLVRADLIPVAVENEDTSSLRRARGNHRRLIAAAAAFLDTCRDVQNVLSEFKTWEDDQYELLQELRKLSRSKLKYVENGYVPIRNVVELAKVNRIILTKDELQSIGVHKPWEKLSDDEQARAIYLCLSAAKFFLGSSTPSPIFGDRLAHNPVKIFGDLKNRKRAAAKGIHVDNLIGTQLIAALHQAKKERESKLKRAAGKKARQSGPRSSLGHFKAKKK